jgi:hypothetical protein
MSLTEFTTDSLELERDIQRSLVVDGTFFVRIAQALVDQAQINSSSRRRLDSVQSTAAHDDEFYTSTYHTASQSEAQKPAVARKTRLPPKKKKGW